MKQSLKYIFIIVMLDNAKGTRNIRGWGKTKAAHPEPVEGSGVRNKSIPV
ncbi:MAG: hypothetical protein PHE15_01450 [Dehalococcoidales bacterium]|nr:hypothetical protein [Dehalococcoidales bacterium]